ncbi:MAG: sugar transferase [Bacteroidales bacterium]|nr:sugar transferase [Bacteroidales bacterium]
MNFRFFFDIIILFLSYCFSVYHKEGSFSIIFNNNFYLFAIYGGIYIITSAIFKKYTLPYKSSNRLFLKKHVDSWGLSALILLSSIYVFELQFPSRLLILGFLGILFSFNIIWVLFLLAYKHASVLANNEDLAHQKTIQLAANSEENMIKRMDYVQEENLDIIELLRKTEGQEFLSFLKIHIDKTSSNTEYFKATSRFNVLRIPYISKNIVNLSSLNDVLKMNKFLHTITLKLEHEGYLICNAITNRTRKKQFLKRYPWGINFIFYSFYFVYKRVWPKLPYFKRIYFYLTKGKDRAISHAEVLGRLYSSGFELVDYKEIGKKTWYVMKKTSAPILGLKPTYGPLIKLRRVGKNGKIIEVLKFRTMHPYSEYIQEYVYKNNDLDDGGKFKDDFRISTLGKIFRKFWIDEFPMFLNILKGDLKIVGIRPLSQHYFKLYPEEFQEYRINFKPGLLPPYYADMPKDIPEIVASEKKYLLQYEKSPFLTDVKYFFLISKNILFKRARSK